MGGFMVHNHKVKGAALGAAALPHREQWMELAALCRDGAAFAVKMAKERIRGGAGLAEPLQDGNSGGDACDADETAAEKAPMALVKTPTNLLPVDGGSDSGGDSGSDVVE